MTSPAMDLHALGAAVLADPLTNKGTAFTAREREELHLEGLIPPAVSSIEQQVARVYQNFQSKQTPIERYIHLAALHDRNETLFFRLLHDHIEEMMPVVYTPVVGEACQTFSHIYRRPRGLYISYEQRDRIDRILENHPRPPAVIVVTDGERILGLGDQGVGGMGIPIGKLSLYTACAGIPPELTLPIMLDVGTDNEALLRDPLYLGMRHPRVRGSAYQEFIDRFVAAIIRVYPRAVLQWEDFLKENAMKQLARFRGRLCTFNDDIQGTAATVLAGIFAAQRVTGHVMREQRMVIAGAGASAQGIADLFVAALVAEGLSLEAARRAVCTVDSRGLVTAERPGLEDFKQTYARSTAEVASYACVDRNRISLAETIANFAPTILIGTSGTPGTFTEDVVRAMAALNERPIVFPLSNPTSRSECTAEEAVRWSDGRALVATGSPFEPVDWRGRRYRVGQGNNAFIFPGVGLGLWVGGVRRVSEGMFLDAANALAEQVTPTDLEQGAVYPTLDRIRECSIAVASAVIRRALHEKQSDLQSGFQVEDIVSRAMWFPGYRPVRHDPARAEASAIPAGAA